MGIPGAQRVAPDRSVSRAWLLAVAVAVAAFLFRLVPVLRGGGLVGMGNYDDGVYYASATGLVHGLLSYRDFLLLHPPGATAAGPIRPGRAADQRLVRFRHGTRWLDAPGSGERSADLENPEAHRSGRRRIRWIRLCRVPPGVYSDKSTLLECPATTALLIAILLLQPLARADSLPHGRAIVAGALLGLSMTIKIWGVVTLLIVQRTH